MTRLPSPLYAIVDPAQTGGRPLTDVVDAMLAGGVSVLQLRAKDPPAGEFLRTALAVRQRTARAGCLFIVNDRVDIALAAKADGVHLGQEDLPLEAARPLMGARLIGISTHSLEQAEAAERGGADYIGFGPMFPTRTKETGYESRGLSMLAAVRRRVRIPIVAIGGITAENVERTWQSGADAAAMIGYLTRGDDVTARVRKIRAMAGDAS